MSKSTSQNQYKAIYRNALNIATPRKDIMPIRRDDNEHADE